MRRSRAPTTSSRTCTRSVPQRASCKVARQLRPGCSSMPPRVAIRNSCEQRSKGLALSARRSTPMTSAAGCRSIRSKPRPAAPNSWPSAPQCRARALAPSRRRATTPRGVTWCAAIIPASPALALPSACCPTVSTATPCTPCPPMMCRFLATPATPITALPPTTPPTYQPAICRPASMSWRKLTVWTTARPWRLPLAMRGVRCCRSSMTWRPAPVWRSIRRRTARPILRPASASSPRRVPRSSAMTWAILMSRSSRTESSLRPSTLSRHRVWRTLRRPATTAHSPTKTRRPSSALSPRADRMRANICSTSTLPARPTRLHCR